MAGRKKPTTVVEAFISTSLAFGLSSGVVHAADPSNPPAAPSGLSPRSRAPLVREARRVGHTEWKVRLACSRNP